MQDVAGFLGSRPPFDAVGADDLARVAAVTETEVSPRGTTIFPQGAGPVEDLRMVRPARSRSSTTGGSWTCSARASCSGRPR